MDTRLLTIQPHDKLQTIGKGPHGQLVTPAKCAFPINGPEQWSGVWQQRAVRGFPVHMEKPYLFIITVLFKVFPGKIFVVRLLEIETEQARSVDTQPPPGLCSTAVYERTGFRLPEDKGLLCAKWGADLDRATAWQRRQPLLAEAMGGSTLESTWCLPLLSGRRAVTGKPAESCQARGAGLYRIGLYLLLSAFDSGFDERGRSHLTYSYERTLLPYPFPELFLALPFRAVRGRPSRRWLKRARDPKPGFPSGQALQKNNNNKNTMTPSPGNTEL